MTLSDRIAILNEGKVVQAGEPHQVYERPATAFAANFLGDANIFEGRVAAAGRLTCDVGELATADPLPAPGSAAMIAVRPEKISILAIDGAAGLDNRLTGVLSRAVYSGMSTTYKVTVGRREVTVFAQNLSAREFAPGDAVQLEWSSDHSVAVQP